MIRKFRALQGIGRKLILSFSVILFLTVLSVWVANYAINRIEQSKNSLTDNSIPALISANQLSTIAVNVVQKSLEMNDSENINKLKLKRKSTLLYAEQILEHLNKLKHYDLSMPQVDKVELILEGLIENVEDRSKLIREKLLLENNNKKEIAILRQSIDALTDIAAIMKIKASLALNKEVNKPNEIAVNELITNELYNVEIVNEIIARLAELDKDIRGINEATSQEGLLSIAQGFDHALRVIVRTVVNLNDRKTRNEFSPYLSSLIELGQDTPDVFQDKLEIIKLSEQLSDISQENITLTQELNTNVNMLSSGVQDYTELAADELQNTIGFSKLVLINIAVFAVLISMAIVWLIVYKNIIIKLSHLSSVTKKLSDDELNVSINVSGKNEFSDIARALDSLKNLTIARKRFNKVLSEKSLQLQRSNEDLSQFAYVASHDLQEPLRMIGSYVQLLEKRYKGKLDQDADKFINYAVDGCLRMQSLIEGLLKFSRVESNKEEMEVVNINEALVDVINDLSIPIQEKNAKVLWDDMPAALASPSQIRTVFRNLISNSIKYCTGRPPVIHIRGDVIEDFVKFSVEDNGIGIQEKYTKKIFIIFKRLHAREKFKGTGIGLSICKKIVERHGGKIWLSSIFGEGTTFYFTFPRQQAVQPELEHKIAV